jgi:hypothetical protein
MSFKNEDGWRYYKRVEYCGRTYYYDVRDKSWTEEWEYRYLIEVNDDEVIGELEKILKEKTKGEKK